MTSIALSNPLVVMALPLESQGVMEAASIPVLYTGVGKINAAWALTRALREHSHAGQQAPLVVNFGTCGSSRFAPRSLVACSAFVQHDMDVTGLGVARGTTPFDSSPPVLEFETVFANLPPAVCGSGDCFLTSGSQLRCDVVDMEAYALAKVCWLEGARFACVKYVTDGADHDAARDWQQNLQLAAAEFVRCYRELAGINHSPNVGAPISR